MNQEKVGKYISKRRKELKLTQEQLAEKLGVTDRSVSRWENGKSMPDVSLFKQLCAVLNITLDELLSGEDKPQSSYETINYIKYQRKIYLYKLITVTIISVLIIGSILYYFFKPYKLEFSDNIDYAKPIYNIDDNIKLYSKFDKNFYIKNNKKDLSEALKDGTITIEQIKRQMTVYDALNDGGTIIYQSKNNKYYLFACNTIDGNKNYYITGNENDFDICATKKTVGLNHTCLRDKLDNIVNFNTSVKTRDNYDAKLITNGNIPSWNIYSGSKGTYAIIKTNDDLVVNDFKKWFNEKSTDYKYLNIYENWYVFVSNGNDLESLDDCINK